MFKYLKNGLFGLMVVTGTLFASSGLSAATRNSYGTKSYGTKSYSKQAPYSGYGKPSSVNGLPKGKITSGYVKRSGNGYTYVNPYARSK